MRTFGTESDGDHNHDEDNLMGKMMMKIKDSLVKMTDFLSFCFRQFFFILMSNYSHTEPEKIIESIIYHNLFRYSDAQVHKE